MIGKKVSHYKILEEIGSGGMGVVYKAEDTKLMRTVALKFVVPRMLNKREDMRRFIREAQTAASLNHPNICTIYEIEEVEEGTFIAMEYIEGRSLKTMLEKGPLNLDKALDLAIQLADGLREAQEKGIIHRDVKSSNIMVTPKGQAKIMDFGLAKVIREARMTETVKIMGTVAYMSPEQASGEAVDHRSDIWSLGVVLYEILSGQLPFQGEHEQLVLYSILNSYHKPITSLQEDFPVELERIIDKCLEKDPGERYQNADDLYEDLRWLKRETESGVVSTSRPTWMRARKKSSRFLLIPAVLGLVIAVFLAGYFLFDWFNPARWWKTSIAVLPIINLNPQGANEAICLLTTDDIISKLTEYSPDLRVIPFDTMKMYKDSDRRSIEIGKELDVEYVLVSRFRSEGEKIQIRCELIDVKTNTNIRTISQNFELEEIFKTQDRISREIVDELGVHFIDSGYVSAKKREPQNVDAYTWYAQGLEVIDNRDPYSDPDEWFPKAIRMMDEALRLDPDYALAHWGMGTAWEAYYVAKEDEEAIETAIKYFEQAYELNPGLAEANLALGWAHFYEEDLDKAAGSFKRALDISSGSPLINCDAGAFLLSVGLYPSALKYFERAILIEPSYIRAYEMYSACNWYMGRFQEGAEAIKKALDLGGFSVQNNLELARHLIMMNKFEEAEKAIHEAEKISPSSTEVNQHRALLFAARKEREKALQIIKRAGMSHLYYVTCIYTFLGMKEEAIKNIQKGIEVGFQENQNYMYTYLLLKMNPCFNSLRDDPRFREMQRKEKEIYDMRLTKAKDIL